MAADVVWYTYTGAEGEVIPRNATHIIVDKSVRVIPELAFRWHRNIVEVIFHEDVERIEEKAFADCPSLRRVIMRGVKVVEDRAFLRCKALSDVECGELELIGKMAFCGCTSLRSINLLSAKIVKEWAFWGCEALTEAIFSTKLERIKGRAFGMCSSLERITIPLKDGLFSDDDIFMDCDYLDHVNLVEGELHETIAALQLVEWRHVMNREVDSINQILPNTDAGYFVKEDYDYDDGEKALTIRTWVRSVLRKIIHYQGEHRRLLYENVATTFQCALPIALSQDIVMNNILPFLELPSYTFEVGDDEEDDSDDEVQSSDSSIGDEEEE